MTLSSSAMDWFVLLSGAIILEAQLSSSMKHLPANITGVWLSSINQINPKSIQHFVNTVQHYSTIIDMERGKVEV